MAHNRLRSRHVSKELWDLPYLRVVIITIIYDNDHVLGKNRLAYVKNRRCVACNQLSHSQHQTICTHREQFCSYLLPDSRGVYFLSCFESGGGSFPIQANIHEWGNYRSHLCSQPSCGWNQRSHSASSGSLSILHQPLSGRNIHQREVFHQDRLCKHRWFFDRLRKAQQSSWLLKNYNN